MSPVINALIFQTARDISEQSGVNIDQFTSDLAPRLNVLMEAPDPAERWGMVVRELATRGVMIPNYIDMVMRRRIKEFVKLSIPTCTSCGDGVS